jgi:hypothetical protein
VGADWTSNDSIVGYPNGLDSETYITRPALELIRHALDPRHVLVPHLLILDEMNLSHVERYFSDMLSAIESREEIPLYEGSTRTTAGDAVPQRLRMPENLFVVGTVNIDETTYTFSPKVLDRANVIEFRMSLAELGLFLNAPRSPDLSALDGKGAEFGNAFVAAATDKSRVAPAAVKKSFESEMLLLFEILQENDAEFGFRTAYEASRYLHFVHALGGHSAGDVHWLNAGLDTMIVQKILPKLNGSRAKLEGLLWALGWICGPNRIDRDGTGFASQLREAGLGQDESRYGPESILAALRVQDAKNPIGAARYPLSTDKLIRMCRRVARDQFVSFAEA